MSLKGVARETLKILEAGQYKAPSGDLVEFADDQRDAVEGTLLYRPGDAAFLLAKGNNCRQVKTVIEVTDERTQVAAHRLVATEGCEDPLILNYASARNPGGGFINGAKAQEEDLARCSGLYPCQLTQPDYYEVNRNYSSLLYTDHLIYSPKIPWFRRRNRDLLDQIFLASVITAPAPNSGQVLRRDKNAWPKIEEALRRRAGMVLAIAREHGHRELILGAWGCGVFRNSPYIVADAFGTWLDDPAFRGCFRRVVFAVYDRSKNRGNLRAFQEHFGA